MYNYLYGSINLIPMRKIILDTNFLMAVFQFKVDIFSEIERICDFNYRLVVLEGSVRELEHLAKTAKGKSKRAALLALRMIESKNIEVRKSEGKYVDSFMLEFADKDTIVATQDMALKRKLTEKGISLIILRQKKYLQLLERKVLH